MRKRLCFISLIFFFFLLEIPIVSAETKRISFDLSWQYAEFSKIHSGTSALYQASSNRKNYVVAINAGHGTTGGEKVKTQCHPDGSPKVTGGSTKEGAKTSYAITSGMTFTDGTTEATVTLKIANILKEILLSNGFDVLMLRDSSDVQLDNVARTVMANNVANIHISLHWDSTTSDKGSFYISVPNVASYRNMEPVKSTYSKHLQLGDDIIAGLKKQNVKIMGSGSMALDLTQTSYSAIPSIDMELGDKASKHDDQTLKTLANGLLSGIEMFYQRNKPVEQPSIPDTPKESEPSKPNFLPSSTDTTCNSKGHFLFWKKTDNPMLLGFTILEIILACWIFVFTLCSCFTKHLSKKKKRTNRILIGIGFLIFIVVICLDIFMRLK